jgi:protein-serine/threonine kinase
MEPDNNRLRLNFPFEDRQTQQNQQSQQSQPNQLNQPNQPNQQNQQNQQSQPTYDASNTRIYPTTPSTFPQPVYLSQQQDYLGGQHQSAQQNGGYFMNNPYPPQQQNQYQSQYQYQNNNVSSPQSAHPGNRQYNEDTNGMIQQFSTQDLSAARGGFNRTPSPVNPRPRTAGDTRGPYTNHLAPPMPYRSPKPEDEERPNPNKYSDNVLKRGTAAKQLVNSFFQENIERARDRNSRAKELDEILNDQRVPETVKQQKVNELAQKEARFLRFIRTKESPNNFTTVKVIGKGAFGEVKLVQRKTDGKIYALKSLIKTEMFKKDQLAHVRAERDILADSKDNPWLVKLHASFQDNAYLYMLMEFLPGGDLMTMLIKYEIFSEDITRFYMAEIVMAIEAVHRLGFLHRSVCDCKL